jgi:hypothetical protein
MLSNPTATCGNRGSTSNRSAAGGFAPVPAGGMVEPAQNRNPLHIVGCNTDFRESAR